MITGFLQRLIRDLLAKAKNLNKVVLFGLIKIVALIPIISYANITQDELNMIDETEVLVVSKPTFILDSPYGENGELNNNELNNNELNNNLSLHDSSKGTDSINVSSVDTDDIELMQCIEATTPEALQRCAIAGLQLEEIRLNQSYQRLRQYIDNQDKLQLDSVQLAWLNYVDKSCQFEMRYLNNPQLNNDAEYQLRFNNCVQNYTHDRRVELDNDFEYIMYRF